MTQTRQKNFNKIFAENNVPQYRMDQVNRAIYKEYIEEYSNITSLPKNIRTEIIEQLGNTTLTLKLIGEAKGKQTQKLLFETQDGHKIEAVRMLYKPKNIRDDYHATLCVSSQSGCGLACTFCATGDIGFKKNLTSDEIVDQVLYFKQLGQDIDTISFMGMGEPFANPHLWEALETLTAPEKMGMSRQKINISTVGLVPGIQKMTEEYPQMNLAISLHTPFNDQREKMMPVTKVYPIEMILESVRQYIEKTNNKVFIAYALMSGTNDTPEHARALAQLIKDQGDKAYLYHVNLIRYHPGPIKNEYKKPNREDIDTFIRILQRKNVNVTLRQSFGADIFAACGQLYAEYATQEKAEHDKDAKAEN